VEVKFYWIDQAGHEYKVYEETYPYQTLEQGLNPYEEDIYPPNISDGDGWWDLKVVAQEDPTDPKCYWDKWSATEKKALLIDTVAPMAKLVKPGNQPWMWKGGTFVTGLDFLMTGTASDKWGIKQAWFELCPEGSWACHWTKLVWWNGKWVWPVPVEGEWIPIGNEDQDGEAQLATATPGVPGQWQATWNSTRVHDGFYLVRFCAEDLAGHSNCWDGRDASALTPGGDLWPNPWPDAHWIFVNNTVTMNLQAGWNLISTPLLPYNTDIESVLFHLIDHGTVESVWTMVYQGGVQKWNVWTPTAGPVDTLTKIVDGQGYWIKMKANDSLTIVGTWTTLGDGESPPSYPVYDGWNLIGYTHWGRPTIWPTDTVGDYLGEGLIDNLQALFYYDPWTNVWTKLYEPHNMVLGKGYWLSTVEAGVIRF
jgi:hypothetical protein